MKRAICGDLPRCCDRMMDCLRLAEPYIFKEDNGVWYMSVGVTCIDDRNSSPDAVSATSGTMQEGLPTRQRMVVDAPLLYCPFCGKQIQSEEEIQRKGEQHQKRHGAVFCFKFVAHAESLSLRAREAAGAIVLAWVASRDAAYAEQVARAAIEKRGWSIEQMEERYLVSRETYVRDQEGLPYFEEALVHGHSLCFIQWRQGQSDSQ